MERHFCTSTYVYNQRSGKFLFIKHKKLKKWLMPGGHWELNELTDDAALREVYEETGLTVRLIGERFPREADQVRPYGIQRNVIEEGRHEHLDLIYFAVCNDEKYIQNVEETDGIGWFTIQEINQEAFDTFEHCRKWCNYFYKEIDNLLKG